MSDIQSETHESLRDLLAEHDRRVRDALLETAETTTGTARVKALHLASRAISAHDSVVGSTLCPLLQDIPGGPEVASRLRRGCEDRAALLARFQSFSEGTSAHNVYPVFGSEVEAILTDLQRSFNEHVHDETARAAELLESANGGVAPDVVAATMTIEANRAPSRPHRITYRYPTWRAIRAIYRGIDRMHEWNDSHHGWPGRRAQSGPIRPIRRFGRRPPSIPELLSRYDETVETLIGELAEPVRDARERASAAYRLAAAVAVHDAIVGGTLCRLLEAVPEGRPAAAVLEKGCRERAELLREWDGLVGRGGPSVLVETHRSEADRIIDELIGSFEAHESHETGEVSEVIERLRERSWKSVGTGLVSTYPLPEWPNPEPAVLAAQMALWADRVPTHTHALLAKHPGNRLLRNFYRWTDHFHDWRQSRRGWPRLT